MSAERGQWRGAFGWCVLAAGSLALACGEDELPPADAVYVRIQNDTDYDFDEVSVSTTGVVTAHSFGVIGAGDVSAYQKIDGIYAHEGGFARAGDLDFCGTVIDHVGDELLGIGYHTFDVFVELGGGCLEGFEGWAFFQQR